MSMYLVTGPNGFLAASLVEKILALNKTVIGLTRTNKNMVNIPFFTKVEDLKRAHADIDTIFHLASYIPYGNFNLPDLQYTTNNIQLTLELCAAYPNAKIVFASSVSVYGKPVGDTININSAFNQPNQYGLSKLAGEAIVQQQKEYSIIRFSSIIGYGMKPVSFVPKVLEQARINRMVKIWGDGNRQQHYIDVRDAVELLLLAAQCPQNIITLGIGSAPVSNLEIGELIAQKLQVPIVFEGLDTSPSFKYVLPENFATLKFSPRYSINNTLESMINE